MKTQLFLQGRHREELSAVEIEALEDACNGVVSFAAGQQIVKHDHRTERSMLLIEGLVCRAMDSVDGDRQIVALHVPGDFVDLHGYPMHRLEHNVEALTDCSFACFPRTALDQLIAQHAHLGRMLWFSTLLDSAMHREWIFRLGRLDAVGRAAHLFAETARRMEMVGLCDGLTYALPVHQSVIASICGITTVHVNRVLRKLREEEVVLFSGGVVRILDLAKLHRLAEFDDGYLYPSGR